MTGKLDDRNCFQGMICGKGVKNQATVGESSVFGFGMAVVNIAIFVNFFVSAQV